MYTRSQSVEMRNRKNTKGAKKTTTEEVAEDSSARIVDGGDQDPGGSQTQERVVVESPRELSETRTDSETEELRRNITRRAKRKRVESVGSVESSEETEEEMPRTKAKKKRVERDEDLRTKINDARKRVEKETETRGRSRRAESTERVGRRRSRSKERGDSEDRGLEKMKIKMERMEEKLRYLQNGRKWNSAANEKQYLHQVELKSIVIDDFRNVLERYFGARGKEVPTSIEEVIKKGESKIEERIKCLRLADKVSWLAVDHYVRDPLCSLEEDDRKCKRAVKEAKEEVENRRRNMGGRQTFDRQKDGYKKVEGSKSAGGNRESRTCHKCGRIGHLKRDCRSTGKDGQGRRDGRN